jgi:hypothetical protein
MQLVFAVNAFAQQNTIDSTLNRTPVNNAIAYFKSAIGLQSGLYNGPEYVFYNRQKENSVFYQDRVFWDKCTVGYDGTVYTDVPVMYDLYEDKVVVQLYNPVYNYSLINAKISDLFLLDHHFVYRVGDAGDADGLKPALYDQLYGGKSEILVRRTKDLFIATDQTKNYPEKDRIFIRNNGGYYYVHNKNSLLQVLKDKKKELRKYISDNSISFGGNTEQACVRVAVYYDKLTQ